MDSAEFPTMFSIIETEEREALIIAKVVEMLNLTFMDLWHHSLSEEMSEIFREKYLEEKVRGCGRMAMIPSSSAINETVNKAVSITGRELSEVQLIFENSITKAENIMRVVSQEREKNIYVLGVSNGREKYVDRYSTLLQEQNKTDDTVVFPMPYLLNTKLPDFGGKLERNWTKEDEPMDVLYREVQIKKCVKKEGNITLSKNCSLSSWPPYIVAGVKVIQAALLENLEIQRNISKFAIPVCTRDFRKAVYKTIIDEQRTVELALDKGLKSVPVQFQNKNLRLGYTIGIYQTKTDTFQILGNAHDDRIDNLDKDLLKSISHYETQCSESCQPGYSRVFGENVGVLPCCWDCIPCPTNHFSTTLNTKNCTPCKGNEQSSPNKTGCYEVEYVFIEQSSVFFIAGTVLVVVGLVFVVMIAVLIWRNEERPTVKASDPGYLYTVLGSIGIGFGVSLIPLMKPTPSSCTSELVCGTLFATLTTCNLAWKCGKIYGVFAAANNFERPKFEVILKRAGQTWLNIGSLVFIFFLLLIDSFMEESAWMYAERQTIYHGPIYLQCTASDSRVILILALILPLTYFITALILAFKMRHFPHNFRETLNIFAATLIGLFCCVMFLSGYSLSPPEIKSLLRAIVLYVISAAFLICLYLPKVLILMQDTTTEEERQKIAASVQAFSLRSTRKSVVARNSSVDLSNNVSQDLSNNPARKVGNKWKSAAATASHRQSLRATAPSTSNNI